MRYPRLKNVNFSTKHNYLRMMECISKYNMVSYRDGSMTSLYKKGMASLLGCREVVVDKRWPIR